MSHVSEKGWNVYERRASKLYAIWWEELYTGGGGEHCTPVWCNLWNLVLGGTCLVGGTSTGGTCLFCNLVEGGTWNTSLVHFKCNLVGGGVHTPVLWDFCNFHSDTIDHFGLDMRLREERWKKRRFHLKQFRNSVLFCDSFVRTFWPNGHISFDCLTVDPSQIFAAFWEKNKRRNL